MFEGILNSHKMYYTIIFTGILVYLYLKYVFSYWKRVNIYSPPQKSFMGHFTLTDKSLVLQFADYHKNIKDKDFFGLNMGIIQLLQVRDLDLIRNVMSKDYSYFEGHGMKAHKDVDPLAQHLFNLEGEEWKRIRVKLTPTFTSSKMRFMFETLMTCTQEMVYFIKQQIKNSKDVEVKELTAKLGTNVIARCAFGLESNCFENPNSEFRKYGNMFFDLNAFQSLFWVLSMFAPNLATMSRIRLTKKEVENFMLKAIKETIEYRTKNKIQRNDFLQLLMEMLNTDPTSEYHLTFDELAAEVFVFFLAGFETSSTAAHYALLEIVKHPDIKEELVRHIDEVIEGNGGKLTYELIQRMHYLDEVIEETLRMYPPVPTLTRRCTKNYQVPGSDTVIEKGTGIAISVYGIHHDPEVYPEPEKFIPERFSNENKKDRHPYTYLPFGEGPRNCIGSRFGIMQLKLTLIYILRNFDIDLSPKTQLPLKFKKSTILLHTEEGIYIKFTERVS